MDRLYDAQHVLCRTAHLHRTSPAGQGCRCYFFLCGMILIVPSEEYIHVTDMTYALEGGTCTCRQLGLYCPRWIICRLQSDKGGPLDVENVVHIQYYW